MDHEPGWTQKLTDEQKEQLAKAQTARQEQWDLYKETMAQGSSFEYEAERCRMEAENALMDVGSLKEEGRRRAKGEADRLLPKHERAVDVRTNSFKAMGDAKADVVFYFATMANTYAGLATMKYTKAAAIRPTY